LAQSTVPLASYLTRNASSPPPLIKVKEPKVIDRLLKPPVVKAGGFAFVVGLTPIFEISAFGPPA